MRRRWLEDHNEFCAYISMTRASREVLPPRLVLVSCDIEKRMAEPTMHIRKDVRLFDDQCYLG
jgi:hypothetical protein